jgi:hypothetical protein
MLTELFLLTIAICTALVKPEEKLPVIVFCLVMFPFYFILSSIEEPNVYFISGVAEIVLIVLLTCIHGCINSKIIKALIPVSLLAILMHFYGWTQYVNGLPIESYNTLVKSYYLTIVGIFLVLGRWGGYIVWAAGFFKSPDSGNNSVVEVFKK